jgi:D-3-phosphoglycerate dehydrogenase
MIYVFIRVVNKRSRTSPFSTSSVSLKGRYTLKRKPLIHVIEPEGPKEWYKPLEDITEVNFVHPDENFSSDELRKILANCMALIITSRCGVSSEDMDHAKNLKIIAKCGGKPSNVDIDAATRHGIAVSYVPGSNNTTVAEYTILMILASMRNFISHTSTIHNNKWRTKDTLLGSELRDKTVGIIGYGAVGREVTRKLQGFDCHVLVHDPYVNIIENEFGSMREAVDLDHLLRVSDVISINCSLTEETRGFISDHQFELIKPNAILINTARGPIVDESALARALQNGQIAGAAIDVFTKEPICSDHVLAGIKNVIITPHVAAWTEEALFREVNGAVQSTMAVLEKRDQIPGLLNPEYQKYTI